RSMAREEAAQSLHHRGGELRKRRQPGPGVHLFQGRLRLRGYPDLDDMFLQQARQRDRKKPEELPFKIPQPTIARAMFCPIMDFGALMGVGPRVTEHTITQIHNSPFPSYEDMRIKD